MAKAFDSMHDSEPTKSFFSLRKSRSVETNETSRNIESVTSVSFRTVRFIFDVPPSMFDVFGTTDPLSL